METVLSWRKFSSLNMRLIFILKFVFTLLLAGLLASYLSADSIRVHLNILWRDLSICWTAFFFSKLSAFSVVGLQVESVWWATYLFFSLLLLTFYPLELISVFAKLLTLTICRKTAEKLLHISSFSPILKLVLLLYLNPYCVWVVVGCSRSELALRLWSHERSLSLLRKQEKAEQDVASTWFPPGSWMLQYCYSIALFWQHLAAVVSIFCVLPP